MDKRFESIMNDVAHTLQESVRGSLNKRVREIDSYWKKVADEPGDKTILNTVFPSDQDNDERTAAGVSPAPAKSTTPPAKFNDTDLTYIRELLTQNQEATYNRSPTFNHNGSEFKTNDPLFTILQKIIK